MVNINWTEAKIENVLNILIENHGKYKSFKKNNKTKEFYTYIGSVCSVPTDGSAIENLLKNIGKEYRTTKLEKMISGTATEEGTPSLRGLSDPFLLYEEYQNLFCPKGSAIKPEEIITEHGIIPLKRDLNCLPYASATRPDWGRRSGTSGPYLLYPFNCIDITT